MGHKWQDPYPYWNSNAHSPLKETVKVWSISFFFILYIIRLLFFFFFSFRFWSTSLLLWPSNGNALEDSHTRLKSFESFALPLVAIGFFLLLFHDMDHLTSFPKPTQMAQNYFFHWWPSRHMHVATNTRIGLHMTWPLQESEIIVRIFTKNTHEIIIRCQNLVKDNQCSLGFGSWQNYGIVDSRCQTKHFQ